MRVIHANTGVTSAKSGYNVCSTNAFGSLMPNRFSVGNYRYGYQNQEMDNEIKGYGNSQNYEYRMHDPRIGRFFAIDPLAANYPYNSPYAFSENRVVDGVELEGLEFVPHGEIWEQPSTNSLVTISVGTVDYSTFKVGKFLAIHNR